MTTLKTVLRTMTILLLSLCYTLIEALTMTSFGESGLCSKDEHGVSYFWYQGYRKCSNCDPTTFLFAGSISCGECCNTRKPEIHVTKTGINKGLIAGLTGLGSLFVLVVVVGAFLFIKRSRSPPSPPDEQNNLANQTMITLLDNGATETKILDPIEAGAEEPSPPVTEENERPTIEETAFMLV